MDEVRTINFAGHVHVVFKTDLVLVAPGVYENNYVVLQPTQFAPVQN